MIKESSRSTPRRGEFATTLTENQWRDFTLEPPGPYIGHWCDDDNAYALFWVKEKPTLFQTPLIDRRYFALSRTTCAASLAERVAQDLWGAIPLDADCIDALLDQDQWLSIWPMSRRALPATKTVASCNTTPRLQKSTSPDAQFDPIALFEIGRAHRGLQKGLFGKTVADAITSLSRLATGETVSAPLVLAAAAEVCLEQAVSPTARDARLILIEVERIIAHLASMARVAHDSGHALLATHLLIAKKQCDDACVTHTGSYHMLDCITLGGVASHVSAVPLAEAVIEGLTPPLATLEKLFPPVARALTGRATVRLDQAELWELNGVNGRASGRKTDLRAALSDPRHHAGASGINKNGDAGARMRNRMQEVLESRLYLETLVSQFGAPIGLPGFAMGQPGDAVSVVEGPRGESWCWVKCCKGRISNVHFQSGSLNILPLILQLGTLSEEPHFLEASFDYSAASAEQ